MTTKPAINALAPWFGGKRTMADRIVEVIGPDTKRLWDLFTGSMAVPFAMPDHVKIHVNDMHGDLINLAKVVSSPLQGPQFYRILRRTPFAQEVFLESQRAMQEIGWRDGPYDLARAYDYFVVSWMGMNGFAGTEKEDSTSFAVRYTSNGGDPATRFRSAVESIQHWRRCMRDWTILRRCGIELAEQIEDKEGTTIYADPPYLKKGATYRHDFTPEQHRRLAQALCRFKETRVVVSYYDSPDLAILYPGWKVIPVEANKGLAQSSARGKSGATKAPEVLLVNEATNDDASWFGGLTP